MAREPRGWSYEKRHKTRPYRATICINGVYKHLGHFATPEEANRVYREERAKHPVLPPTGGLKAGTYTPPRLVCKNCKRDIAKTKFAIHQEACFRHYPEGRSPWMPAPKRKKSSYIKKGDRIPCHDANSQMTKSPNS